MPASVYIETTVFSYLTARPSKDLVTEAHQKLTAAWWATAAVQYRLVTSVVVSQETAAGNPAMAAKRLSLVSPIALVEVTEGARDLARLLLKAGLLPPDAGADALHVAVAATNHIEYLATWNLRHLAGAVVRHRIENALRARGFEPPEICTPEELLIDSPTDGSPDDP